MSNYSSSCENDLETSIVLNVNLDALKKSASNVFQVQCTSIQEFNEGGFHKVYILKMMDGNEYIGRVAFPVYPQWKTERLEAKRSTPLNGKFAPYSIAALGVDMPKNKKQKTNNSSANFSSGKAKSPSLANTMPNSLKSSPQEFTKSGDSSLPPNNPTMTSSLQQQPNEDLPVPTLPITSAQRTH
ncbi:hypothetical protein C2G38_2208462 [Gigaspora rosea]|uniref:Uncharacterized protein n=1 Tax=Gigaspora rosea TaxID=44941 RepID=A0A397UQB5_9GLOM|nr:hypothetical protein C2G38_2208462 [Gigaspora rosea]